MPQELEAKVRSQREELKTLRATYDKTEDDLKALQSVGQIIGEVLRQLDEERCAYILFGRTLRRFPGHDVLLWRSLTPSLPYSHRQGQQRASLRRRVQDQARQGEAHTGDTRRAGHDDAHHHARAASGGAF